MSDRYRKRKMTEYETVQKNLDWTRRQFQIMTSERDRLTGVGLDLTTDREDFVCLSPGLVGVIGCPGRISNHDGVRVYWVWSVDLLEERVIIILDPLRCGIGGKRSS